MKFILKIHRTPLFLAVQRNRSEMVQLLLERKELDVNAVSKITN